MVEPTHENVNALGHEPIEADVRAIWKTAVVLVVVVAVSYALIFGIMSWFLAKEGQRSAGQVPMADADYGELTPLQRLRIRESEVLGSYDWVDEEAQVARIPIERATEIVADSGVSATLEQPQTTPQADQQPSQSQESAAGSGRSQE